jgi:mannosyl-oligosaccharide alpha-1,3-glucosidase
MLPIWYTAFREASVTGIPVLRYVSLVVEVRNQEFIWLRFGRPHYVVFPQDEAGFSIDDQWFVGGSGLLVKPVTQKGATETSIYLAEDQVGSSCCIHDL